MEGIVRWYSNQGFGFIDPLPTADNESERAYYFHISAVKNRTTEGGRFSNV